MLGRSEAGSLYTWSGSTYRLLDEAVTKLSRKTSPQRQYEASSSHGAKLPREGWSTRGPGVERCSRVLPPGGMVSGSWDQTISIRDDSLPEGGSL
jgi:hypothetical protein